MTAEPRRSSFRIRNWTVLPEQNRLEQEGASVEVEPKMMEVLVELADRSGGVATREELYRIVWPDVIVSDDALTRCINQLRRALRDDTRHPQYIETISKRGYRLIPPVERIADPAAGRTRSTESRLLGTGILGPRAAMLIRDCSPAGWNAIAAGLRHDGDVSRGDLDLVWNGVRLIARAPEITGAPPSVRLVLRARSLSAAAPFLIGLSAFAIACLAVYGNVVSWGFGAAIVMASTLLGALAGGRLRGRALRAGREALSDFMVRLNARSPDGGSR